MQTLEKSGEKFYFDDSLLEDSTFLEEFDSDNYHQLEEMFLPDDRRSFLLCRKELITDEFIEDFQFGMNSRWSKKDHKFFDPAIVPYTSDSYLNKQDMFNIQSALAEIYTYYGKEGLKIARGINLAHGLMSVDRCIDIPDDNDEYDLPINDNNNHKLITLTYDNFDPVKRSLDAMGCSVLTNYPNENVKSALFFMPEILYHNGRMLSYRKIQELIQIVEEYLPVSSNTTLDYKTFWNAVNICKYIIYVERNKDSFPKKDKGNSKVKKII